ncbi:hypothetical protein [Melaminivora sp.]|uniref:hypothetical protein n=1 Tax=Melaminivora sp. TaxID=1933032 RepID=UPI0028AD874D|nr:hypothetical protein [Melaminivora sp.]
MRIFAAVSAAALLAACQPAPSMDDIKGQVLQDSIDQYNIVAKSGSVTDKCVHAGLAAAAAVQAKDSAAFERWKQTQRADCAAAGVPQ